MTRLPIPVQYRYNKRATTKTTGDEKMNNAQTLNLQPGDYLDEVCNGRIIAKEVLAVRKTGTCINERSGAFGHAYACLTVGYHDSDLVVEQSVHSDEYSQGENYPTHDAEGNRIRGWQLVGRNHETN